MGTVVEAVMVLVVINTPVVDLKKRDLEERAYRLIGSIGREEYRRR